MVALQRSADVSMLFGGGAAKKPAKRVAKKVAKKVKKVAKKPIKKVAKKEPVKKVAKKGKAAAQKSGFFLSPLYPSEIQGRAQRSVTEEASTIGGFGLDALLGYGGGNGAAAFTNPGILGFAA